MVKTQLFIAFNFQSTDVLLKNVNMNYYDKIKDNKILVYFLIMFNIKLLYQIAIKIPKLLISVLILQWPKISLNSLFTALHYIYTVLWLGLPR